MRNVTLLREVNMKKIFMVLIFVLMSNSAFAEESSLGFKEIKLGSNISDLIKNENYACNENKDKIGADKDCNAKTETIAGVPVIGVKIRVYNELIHAIYVRIDSDSFNEVIKSLEGTYGKSSKTTETIRFKMGGNYENEIFTWRNNSQSMIFKKYNRVIDESILTITTNFYSEEFNRRNSAASNLNSEGN